MSLPWLICRVFNSRVNEASEISNIILRSDVMCHLQLTSKWDVRHDIFRCFYPSRYLCHLMAKIYGSILIEQKIFISWYSLSFGFRCHICLVQSVFWLYITITNKSPSEIQHKTWMSKLQRPINLLLQH